MSITCPTHVWYKLSLFVVSWYRERWNDLIESGDSGESINSNPIKVKCEGVSGCHRGGSRAPQRAEPFQGTGFLGN